MANAVHWSCEQVADWLDENDFSHYKKSLCEEHKVDGKALLTLTEKDFRQPPLQISVLGDIKRLMLCISRLQNLNPSFSKSLSRSDDVKLLKVFPPDPKKAHSRNASFDSMESGLGEEDSTSASSENGSTSDFIVYTRNVEPEKWKTIVAYVYMTLAVILDSFLVVVVHNRTPDRTRYPPLPDLFLDNIPYMPWGFQAAEIIILTMGFIMLVLAILHKHR